MADYASLIRPTSCLAMPELTFSGYVLPKGRPLTINDLPKGNLELDDLKATFAPKVESNIITITWNLNRELKEEELVRLYMRGYDMVRTAIDLIAFASGHGFTIGLHPVL